MTTSPLDPFDHALVARGHTPMYVMHKYWARKPHNVVAEYIKHYSRPGEIVFDPFLGSGVTVLEAMKLGRKAVGTDLSPVSIFITSATGSPVSLELVKKSFEKIRSLVCSDIEALYGTTCRKCGETVTLIASCWDRDTKTLKDVRYECRRCMKRYIDVPSSQDLDLLSTIEARPIPRGLPDMEFPEGITFNQGRREAGPRFSYLFTHRNLLALYALRSAIQTESEKTTKSILTFAFTSMLRLASKMTPVRPSRPFSSFWAINSYWVPPEFMEQNVWELFDSAVQGKQGILKGKEESNESIHVWKPAKRFEDLAKNANLLLMNQNVLELSKLIPNDSIDYVFTDPPYGGAVPYAELSTLWALWLGLKMDFDDEITINDAKDFDYYHKMLLAAFRQVYRVLKPDRYLTVTFHSTDIRVWNSIIRAVASAGFDLEKIIYQPPARASAKGLLVPYGSAVGDYYIRFRKPKIPLTLTPEEAVSEIEYERAVLSAAKTILAERGEPTAYTFILNGIIVHLRKAGVLLSGNRSPEKVMKDYLGKEFDLIDDHESKGKGGQRWWFKNPTSIPYLDVVPLTDRLETAIVGVLSRKVKVSFDDVLQEIFIKFPNAMTPETERVTTILEEYAKPTSDGMWTLKPIVKVREGEHTTIIGMLAELGRSEKYSIQVGLREQSEDYRGKKLKSFNSGKVLMPSYLPVANIDRIRQIDLIWATKEGVSAIFEVENTTAITEALVRGSNLTMPGIDRFIVIPKERERLLFRKLQEPMFAEKVGRDGWKFIYYNDLEKALSKSRTMPALTLLRSITQTPTNKLPDHQSELFD